MQLTITKHPKNANIAETTRSIGMEGASIGRKSTNTWPLDDPERYLSSRHVEISYDNGAYFLTDVSTNGTYLNDAEEPVGKGVRVPLSEGDRLIMGDYEFTVSLSAPLFGDVDGGGPFAAPPPPAPAAPPAAEVPDPFGAGWQDPPGFAETGGFNSAPVIPGIHESEPNIFLADKGVVDPLEALSGASSARKTDDFLGPGSGQPFGGPAQPGFNPAGGLSQPDNADPMNQSVDIPLFAPEKRPQSPGGAAPAGPADWAAGLFDDDDPITPAQAPAADVAPAPPGAGFNAPPPVMAPQMPPPDFAPPQPEPLDPNLFASPTQAPVPDFAPAQPEPLDPNLFASPTQAPPPDFAPPQAPPPDPATFAPPAQTPPPRQPPPQQPAAAEPAPRAVPRPGGGAALNAAAQAAGDAALLQALGLDGRSFSDIEMKALSMVAGQFVMEAISGLIKVLGSRSSIKNEFRMSVTTIQPVENNPLKFAATVEDAVEKMFVKRGKAYKPAVEAVRESFDSIADHQVAVLAGMRSAFNGVLERFNPEELQKRFDKQGSNAIIPGMKKARYWEMYNEYFLELTRDLDDSFQFLFGDDFVQAYEAQLQKLAGARRRSKS